MAKSPDAFRTISEVAEWLGVQAHVLRFWESKFSQVKPIKRAGGRRYYRPSDMLLLGGIKKLLHDDGLTIKGAQKLLREKGNAFVSDLSQPLDDLTVAVIEGTAEDVTEEVEVARTEEKAAQSAKAREESVEVTAAPGSVDAIEQPPTEKAAEERITFVPKEADVAEASEAEVSEEPVSDNAVAASEDMDTRSNVDDVPVMPSFRAHARGEHPPQPTELTDTSHETPDSSSKDAQDDSAEEEVIPSTAATREKFEVTPPKPAQKEPPKPKIIDVGPLPDLADFPEQPSVLSQIARIKSLSREDAAAIQPLLARLTRLRASMTNPRRDIGKD